MKNLSGIGVLFLYIGEINRYEAVRKEEFGFRKKYSFEKGSFFMTNSFYPKENLKHLDKLKELAPEQLQAFTDYNKAVFKEGALSKKEKEIIAVAIAHVTECPYCIDSHTRNAK